MRAWNIAALRLLRRRLQQAALAASPVSNATATTNKAWPGAKRLRIGKQDRKKVAKRCEASGARLEIAPLITVICRSAYFSERGVASCNARSKGGPEVVAGPRLSLPRSSLLDRPRRLQAIAQPQSNRMASAVVDRGFVCAWIMFFSSKSN